MNLFEAKMLAMWVLGVASVFLGLIPVVIIKKLGWAPTSTSDGMSHFSRTLHSGILCFGGGVLMATGFLHMLPEVYEGWESYVRQNDIDINLSLGIVAVCAGFFLVYFVEEVAHLIADRHAHNRTDVSIHRAVSIRGCPVSLEGPSPPCDPCSYQDESEECQGSTICQQERTDCVDKEYCREVISSAVETQANENDNFAVDAPNIPIIKNHLTNCYGSFENTRHIDRNEQVDLEHVRVLQEREIVHLGHPEILHGDSGHKQSLTGHHHHGLMSANDHCIGASMRGLLVIIALSLHEVLEGLAVGLQKKQSGVLQLFAAIASHKFVIAFCIGLELKTTGVRFLLHVIYILVFSLVTPLGIGIGIWVTYYNSSEDSVETVGTLVMQGLACGTILYVAFFEILERERSKSTVGLIQWTLLLTGFSAIMALQVLANEPENEAISQGAHP